MAKQNVQKLDACVALAGIRASRVWTLVLLWTVMGCPESGRFGVVLNQLDAAGGAVGIFFQHSRKFSIQRCHLSGAKVRR